MRRTLGVCSATSNQVIAQLDQHVVPTYGRFALALSHGEGMYVWDCAGNKYVQLPHVLAQPHDAVSSFVRFLDMGGGIAVNSLGHRFLAILVNCLF
jgi:acetylornithine/succinyldiaminopimelate/putrescine aminotransferase